MQKCGQRVGERTRRSLAIAWTSLSDGRTYAAQASRLYDAQAAHDHSQSRPGTRPVDGSASLGQTYIPLNALQRGSVALLSALGAVSKCASVIFKFPASFTQESRSCSGMDVSRPYAEVHSVGMPVQRERTLWQLWGKPPANGLSKGCETE